jgi:hypothetical protein
VGDSATANTCKGYLYAHLVQTSIPVHVGDIITQGQFLGNLVTWPNDNFHHCHFTRLQDTGVTWGGSWLSIENPNTTMQNMLDTHPPVFEPARGTDLLAFCANETSTYQSPTALHGAVDIIAHVGDQIESNWVCSVQSIRYTIYPLHRPDSPIVNNKLSVNFNMSLDTYGSGQHDAFLINLLYKQDSTCRTQGDYSAREFYHIITNSNGDEIYDTSDQQEAWNTTQLPDGQYVIRVVARDAYGNATADSMTVSTWNGNPSEVNPVAPLTDTTLRAYPCPSAGPVTLVFSSPRDRAADASIFDLSGRLVRVLRSSVTAPGAQRLEWDGLDLTGHAVANGLYLCRVQTLQGAATERVILAR